MHGVECAASLADDRAQRVALEEAMEKAMANAVEAAEGHRVATETAEAAHSAALADAVAATDAERRAHMQAEAAAADDGQWDHLLDQLIRAPRKRKGHVLLDVCMPSGDVLSEAISPRAFDARLGRACPSWDSYVKDMEKAGACGGELEITAVASALNLTTVVIRPGVPTVILATAKPRSGLS